MMTLLKRLFDKLDKLFFRTPSGAQVGTGDNVSGLSGVEQRGWVRELNSGKMGIPGVRITFAGAETVISDGMGAFRLVFADKKPGDPIFLVGIAKSGYELVNAGELASLTIGSDGLLGQDIILAKTGVLARAKSDYGQICVHTFWEEYQKAKKGLANKMARKAITEWAYWDEIECLREQCLNMWSSLSELFADAFARMDLDDRSPVFRRAYRLFVDSRQIDRAILLLEGKDFIGRIKKRMEEKGDPKETPGMESGEKADGERGLLEDLRGMRFLSQLYMLSLQKRKAERMYDDLSYLGFRHPEILWACADFYRENDRLIDANALYREITAHPDVWDLQKALAYGHFGESYTLMGNYREALGAFRKARKAHELLWGRHPDILHYRENLALSLERLGATHQAMNQLKKAVYFFEQFKGLSNELYAAFPRQVQYKSGLAISYERLGAMHDGFGDSDKALDFYGQGLQLLKELHELFPKDMDFKNRFAQAHLRLGHFYEYKKEDEVVARSHYAQCEVLWAELVDSFPLHDEFRARLTWVRKVLED